MTTKLRVYISPKPPSKDVPYHEGDVILQAAGDAAKTEARTYLEKAIGKVRSLNWGPDVGKPDMLIAYVLKGS